MDIPILIRESSGTVSAEDAQNYLTKLSDFILGNNFSKLATNSLEPAFSDIWMSLFTCVSQKNVALATKSSKTLSLFLNYCSPFYLDQLNNSLISVLNNKPFDTHVYPYIAASFVHLLNQISLPFKQQFIHYVDFAKYFTFNDAKSFENIPLLISRLDSPPKDWLKRLIDLYMKTYKKEYSIHFMRALTEVIKHSPQNLMQHFLSIFDQSSSENIEIIGFILNTIPVSQLSCDFTKIANQCLELLQNYTANATIENVLAIISKIGGELKVGDEKTTITFKDVSIDIDFSTLSSKISSNKFSLQFELISIKPQDGSLVIQQKAETISKFVESYDPELVVDMYERYSNDSYSDKMSGIIRSLANCSNYLLSKSEKFKLTLRKYCFSKIKTIYHAADVSLIFSQLDYSLCIKKCGKGFINDTLLQLYSFLSYKNPKINQNAMLALKQIKIEDFHFLNLDFFDEFYRTAFFLKSIKSKDPLHSVLFQENLIGESDLDIITLIFKYLASLSIKDNKNILYSTIKIAEDVIIATLNIFRDAQVHSRFMDAMQARSSQLSVDVVADTTKFFEPAQSAIKFLANEHIVVPQSVINSFTTLFSLMPRQISYLLLKHPQLLLNISIENNLKNCGDIIAHFRICEAIVSNNEINTTENPWLSFEHVIASQVLVWPSEIPLRKLGPFAKLIGKTLKGAIPIVKEFESHLTNEEKEDLYGSTRYVHEEPYEPKFDIKSPPENNNEFAFKALEDGDSRKIMLLMNRIDNWRVPLNFDSNLFIQYQNLISKYVEVEINDIQEAINLSEYKQEKSGHKIPPKQR
ncbi:hypothetical protein TVAG_119300 [Trichomonas vaginalis G3]|uniref:Uncharacterized protein n=1 Tax=Trichomonas vaginalis (strain ATCC PRA-98 / G3) TaxID=412133 RepID=A2D777_TRIV3|nr:hypothetical protein TVAG_119300 [Trichomonas vaginalis G3]|eukprot:XP_001276842.1 hypothetical protein [Trichomonas vaginalis G3]